MPPTILRPSEINHVAGWSFFEADITPTTKVMIFSGIAAPTLRTEDEDDTLAQEVIVKLETYVASLDDWTAQVGLAAIENDESRFIFAVDNPIVETDPGTDELQLRVQTVVNGDKTILHRFGFQVVAKLTKVASEISGTIRVPHLLVNLTNKVEAEVEAFFRIRANRIERTPGDSVFPLDKLVPVANGRVAGITLTPEDSFVKYVIEGSPFNTPLRVTVDVAAELENLKAMQPAGSPTTLTLTRLVPAVSGVDFVVYRDTLP